MLQLKFGGFKIALVEPNVIGATATSSSVVLTGGGFADTDVVLPKIEASYRMSQDKFFFDVGGGYNFGKGYAKLQLNYDVNGAAYGLARNAAVVPAIGYAPFATVFDTAKNDFADVTRFGGALVLGDQINDMVGVEFGGALQQFTNDLQNSDIENTTHTLYLNFPFTVADGVVLTPELGYMDWGDLEVKGAISTKADAGTNTYFGLYSRINF